MHLSGRVYNCRICFAVVLLSLGSLVPGCANRQASAPVSTPSFTSLKGEYGSDLNRLRDFLSGPACPGESNFYIDLWGDGELINYAKQHGLTNNHAFFVISHGGGVQTVSGPRYAYFPEAKGGSKAPLALFSARDLARILGPEKVREVHNLMIAGCNFDNIFSSTELRLSFPNATNIVHSLPGKNAHETLFRHALIYPSRDVQTLYLQPDEFKLGMFDEKWREKKARPYIAELFLPGSIFPFKIQTAGRELLDHTSIYAQERSGASRVRSTAN